jgi:prepilin peptidase CpaA
MFTLPPQKVEMVLLLVLLCAAIYDVRYRRIPNWLNVTGVLIGLAVNWIIGPPDAGILFSLAGLGIAFGLYLVLYLLRAMGAGDVKLMAAVGALLGPSRWFGLFLVTAIIGGIMALVLVLMRRRTMKTFWNIGYILSEMRFGRAGFVNNPELDVRSSHSVGLPHGAVIAIGAIFYLAISAHFAL